MENGQSDWQDKNRQESATLQSDSAAMVQEGSKPSFWSRKVVLVMGILVAVGAVGVGSFMLGVYSRESRGKQTAAPTPVAQHKSLVTAAKVLHDVKQLVAAKGELIVADKTDMSGGTINDYGVYNLVATSVDGRRYMTLPAKGDGFGVAADLVTTTANYRIVDSYFQTAKFTEKDRMKGSTTDTNDAAVTYENEEVVCHLQQQNYGEGARYRTFIGVSCADRSEYKAQAAKVQPFYETLQANDDWRLAWKGEETMTFGRILLGDGAEGYKTAKVDTSNGYTGGVALFYREASGQQWIYLASSNGIIDCDKFNSKAARKAFANEECSTATEIVKVKSL